VIESLDGYTLTSDPISGFVCYAQLSADERELLSTGIPLNSSAPKIKGLIPHLRINKETISKSIHTAREQYFSLAHPTTKANPLPAANGNVVGICLIVDFPDQHSTIPRDEVDRFLNQVGYSGNGNNGSVRDYFYDVSDGHLIYTNLVPAMYYRASHNKTYYDNPTEPAGAKARELIAEALTNLDASGVDFSEYDSNGDGYIDAVNCFYDGSRASAWAMGLWPHSGGMSFSADGVSTARYQITDMRNALSLGTFCHENGHMLCFWPDLYDDDGQNDSAGAGKYCLMADYASSTNPVEPSAYLKDLVGWAITIAITSDMDALIVAAGSNQFEISNQFLRFPYSGFTNEYFMIEYRHKTGRDQEIPDSGLAIWHIDTSGDNSRQQMSEESHYEAALEQSDGRFDLENDRNSGDTNDLWAQSTGKDFGPLTQPNSNWWDESPSGMTIHNISEPDLTHIMTFSVGVEPQNHPPALFYPRVEPVWGNESSSFEFLVDYYDPDGDPPRNAVGEVHVSRAGFWQSYEMTLWDGTPSNGTYRATTTLPLGSYEFECFFADTAGNPVKTPWQPGPNVGGGDGVPINIQIKCQHVSLDLILQYSRNGTSGPWKDIPITREYLDPIFVPAGSIVDFRANVDSLNYDFQEWELYENHISVAGNAGSEWPIQVGLTTTSLDLDVSYLYTPQNYTVSGSVLEEGSPVPGGAILDLRSAEQTLTVETQPDGSFSFSGVRGGVDVSITPSANGYAFAPAVKVYNRLKADSTEATFVAYQGDEEAPTTSFLDVPSAVNEDSVVAFSWSGQDDVSVPSNLVYQYKLEPVDADWSAFLATTTMSYDLQNGCYTFSVRAQDEAGNVNNVPLTYSFVVNAAPRVTSAVRNDRSVWSSRVTLDMPVGAPGPGSTFVLLPEHSGLTDPELVPIRLHRADQVSAVGANEIVAASLALTVLIEKVECGWVVTLPESMSSGTQAEFDIVWGKIAYFGWQEQVDIPGDFPNFRTTPPEFYTSNIQWSFLDQDLRMWRLASKRRKQIGGTEGTTIEWIFMDLADRFGSIIDERTHLFLPGVPDAGSGAEEFSCNSGRILSLGSRICLTWSDQRDLFTSPQRQFRRYGLSVLNHNGDTVNSYVGDWQEKTSVSLANAALDNGLVFGGVTQNPASNDLWFTLHDSEGNLRTPRIVIESAPTTNSRKLSLTKIDKLGQNIVFLFEEVWTTAGDKDRKRILYHVQDANGVLVRAGTPIHAPLLDDAVAQTDEFTYQSSLTDKEGKHWISFTHQQTGQPIGFYYVIIGADGNIWKGATQVASERLFHFCDADGYVWAREGNLLVLNPNDTLQSPPRRANWIPSQNVGVLAADRQREGDNYRPYDRWSQQEIELEVPAGYVPSSMEIFDLDLWANDLHPAAVEARLDGAALWSHSGVFDGNDEVNVTGILGVGRSVLTMSQQDFLGGQILVTFPYSLPLPTVTQTETQTTTLTRTETPTATSSPTRTATKTDTQVPPIATSTPTITPELPTATPTGTRTSTPTWSPTASLTLSATVTPTPNPAFDANNDGIINAADLLLFLSDWMEFIPTKTPTPVE
jgi:M6 family metalloprotease-like protein